MRYAFMLVVCAAIVLWAVATPAAPPTNVEPGSMILSLVAALQAGKWYVAIGIAISLLTWLLDVIVTRFRENPIPRWLVPWIAAALGMASAVVAALIAGADIATALVGGLVTGKAASGFWSLVGKHLLTSKDTKAKRAEARKLANGRERIG
jgi:hypothetical protein